MQALESSEGVVSHAGPKDKLPRGTLLSKIEVDCRMPGQQVESHSLTKLGKQWIVVLSSAVPTIIKHQVWDGDPDEEFPGEPETEAERVAQAERNCHSAMVEEMRARTESQLNRAEFSKFFNGLLKRRDDSGSLTDAERTVLEDWDKYRQVTQLSPERSFYEKYGRGIKPLKSLRVLEGEIPVPEERDSLVADNALLAALVQSVRGGETVAAPDIMAKLEELVATNRKLAARVDELEDAATQVQPAKRTKKSD